jgi:hypothetical protein
MSDSMEEFFRKHREALDSEIPGSQVWDGIRNKLNPQPKSQIYWKVAAVFFFFCSVGLFLSGAKWGTGIFSEDPAQGAALTDIENFYTVKINQREAWIAENAFAGMNPGIEYQRLTSMYEVLRLAWEKNPSGELRDAMALNLIIRLDILNRITETGLSKDAQTMAGTGMVYR